MDLINSIASEDRIINYLKKNVSLLMTRSEYSDKMKIIYAVMNSVEIYFSNLKKCGALKKAVVLQIITNTMPGVPIKEICDVIEFIIGNKLIKAEAHKLVLWFKRHQLKKKIKKFSLTS